MKIIDNIIKIMEIKGISAYKLEKEAGIKQTTFSSWKNGSQPTADKLLAVMQYIGATPNEIFDYSDFINLSENDKEMLTLFQQLPEREQYKYIARLEDAVQQIKQEKEKSSNTKIG